MNVTVLNPPIPPKPAHCSEPGCKYEANRVWLMYRWVCNYHYYRFLRDTEAA